MSLGTEVPRGAALVYLLLGLLGVGAISALAAIYAWGFVGEKQHSLLMEIGKGLVQIVTVAVIGSVIKFLMDDHQRRQKEAAEDRQRQLKEETEARVRAQEDEIRLETFRTDKV